MVGRYRSCFRFVPSLASSPWPRGIDSPYESIASLDQNPLVCGCRWQLSSGEADCKLLPIGIFLISSPLRFPCNRARKVETSVGSSFDALSLPSQQPHSRDSSSSFLRHSSASQRIVPTSHSPTIRIPVSPSHPKRYKSLPGAPHYLYFITFRPSQNVAVAPHHSADAFACSIIPIRSTKSSRLG